MVMGRILLVQGSRDQINIILNQGSYNNWHRESGFAGGGEGVRSGLPRLSSGNMNTTYTSGNAWARWSAHNTPSGLGRFVFGRI